MKRPAPAQSIPSGPVASSKLTSRPSVRSYKATTTTLACAGVAFSLVPLRANKATDAPSLVKVEKTSQAGSSASLRCAAYALVLTGPFAVGSVVAHVGLRTFFAAEVAATTTTYACTAPCLLSRPTVTTLLPRPPPRNELGGSWRIA